MKAFIRRREFAVAMLCSAAQVRAQAPAFPDRPIRLVVPMPAGGGTDYWARLTMAKVSDLLGQQVLIDNKPGAGTMIGAETVARARPDGYTLLVGDIGTFSVNPSLYKKISYDPAKDFEPITMTSRQALLLVVPAASPFTDVKALVSGAKSQPGKLNFGSSSVGSPHHLAMEVLQSHAGIRMNHVPYKGGAPLANDIVGGQIDVAFMDLPISAPHIRAGRLRALAAFTNQRLAAFPNVPTLMEQGYRIEPVSAWQGLMAPAGVPRDVVERVGRAYAAAVKDPEIDKRLQEMGMEAIPSSPQEFGRYVQSEREKWAAIIREKGISAE